MSNRLWSDILSGGGRRFWFALNSSPGFVSPATASLTLSGRQPIAVEPTTVFRTPAPLILTFNGLLVASALRLTPAQAALTVVGNIPNKETIRVITPTATLNYDDLPSLAPTILFIQTISPTTGAIQLNSLELNVSQGGNIGFVSPMAAQLSFVGYQSSFVFEAIGAGALSITGLQPTIHPGLTLQPDVGFIPVNLLSPFISKSFTWVDVDPSPPMLWTRQDNVIS